ncbi:DUF2167 domain-containing protein [Niastella caeni]|uniref:DUF2167 domain-containing protein n=1 Tax=Niastella caeni TaxID=2569763 RepID=A0A4S8I163_9BACT|nr:DUF2167 domain-containing protein [Niastella caeni]THU40929.1 DUF2167 domain-containing protein [Niastella caeni]
MQKAFFLFIALLVTGGMVRANDEDSLTAQLVQQIKMMDSVNKAMKYQTGVVKFSNGIAQLNVPQGFKYLNAEQSNFVLTDLWGNPPQENIMGMLFPEAGGPYADSSYAFIIKYNPMGYVKDEDADKINYDEMLTEMQKEEKDANAERLKQGYPSIHIVGWAQKPFYDKTNKVLHWAKRIQFGTEDHQTLNYDIRILGRKGILSMNAVASMSELEMVKKDINKVLHIAEFTDGNKYSDFDPKIDKVAAWGIGALVAGKVLAKVGAFAFLGKFLKVIILGIGALIAGLIKFFKKKKQDETLVYEPVPAPPADEQSNTPNA